jgi:hypothetical protein
MNMKRHISILILFLSIFAGKAAGQCIVEAGADETICEEGTTNPLGGSIGDGTSALWTSSDGGTFLPLATDLNASWQAPAGVTGPVTLTLTGSGGSCGPTSDTKQVTVNPVLAASVSIGASANPVCAGTSVTFTAIPANGGTPSYEWYKNGTTSIGTGNPLNYEPANGDKITVVMTSSESCTVANPVTSNEITMTVNTNLNVSVSIAESDNSVCAGTSVTYTATPTNGGTPSYQWYKNGTTSIGTGNPLNYEPANGDKITAVMTSSESCTVANPVTSNEITMTVNTNLIVSVSIVASANPVCTGASVTYTASPTNGGTPTYQWYKNGTTSIGTVNPLNYVPSNGDKITVVMTSSETCTSVNPVTSNEITMTVDPVTDGGTAAGSDQTICDGATPANIFLTGSVGGVLRWEKDDNHSFGSPETIGVTSTTLLGSVIGALTETTYFRAVVKSGVCSLEYSNDAKITVHDDLSAIISGGASTVCYNTSPGTMTAIGSGGNGSFTYQWYNTSIGLISGATNADYTPGNLTTDIGYSCILGSTCGSIPTSTKNIDVRDQIILSAVSQDAQICSGSSALINLSGLLGSTTSTVAYTINGVVQDSVSGVDSYPGGDASFSTEELSAASNGKILQITEITTGTSPSCAASFVVSTLLIVNSATVPTISGNAAPCINSTGNDYTTEIGMTDYSWSWSAGGTKTGGGGTGDNTLTLTWVADGAQWVRVNYTNLNSCTAASSTVKNITVSPLPVPTISGPLTICEKTTGVVYTTETEMYSYDWNIPSGGTITGGGDGNNFAIVTWNTPGTNSINVTYNNASGCSPLTPKSVSVTVNALPVPAIGGPASACINSTGNIYSTAAGMTDYTWTVPGGTITAGSGTKDITVTWTSLGNQSVSVNYKNVNSCTAQNPTTYPVTVNPLPVPTITGPAAACVNSAGNIYTTAAGMLTYNWSVTGGTIMAGTGTNSITVTWNTAGSQNVSLNYINTNNCTAASPTIKTVTVNPLPIPTISGSSSVCVNSSGNVYTTEYGMSGYNWVVTGGSVTSGSGTNSITVTWNTAGAQSVSVNYLNANNCTASSATVKPVTVNALPSPTITGSLSVCVNSTGNVYTTESGMSGYSWTVTGGTITSGSSTNSITVTWNSAGSKTVSVNYINASSCTAASPYTLNVTVNALPVPAITGPAAPNVNTTGNVYSTEASMTGYSWTVSAGGTIAAGTGTNSITVTWNGSGAQTVSVNYINSNTCTAASPTVYNVVVNALPVATNVSISGDVRSGVTLYGTYTYTDADGDNQGTSTYQWYTGSSSGGADPAVIPLATASSFMLTDTQLDNYIGFSVVPVALSGATPGNMSTMITWVGPVINDIPVATISPITGSLNVNSILTGHYVYSDIEGDIESGTSFQWYSSGTETGTYLAITGETGVAHVIGSSEQGKYYKIYITPAAATGNNPGAEVKSPAYGPANTQPVASNVQVTGTPTVGSTLTGSYDFDDVDPADLQGTSIFRWLRNGTIQVPGAIGTSYVITANDEGYKLSFEVTPVSLTGYPNTGTPVQSAQTVNVTDPSSFSPVAEQVCIEGIRSHGQILRGKYYYDFYKSEGTSLYQWYRNGVPITGATGIQYTLDKTLDIDSNADITFEVIPKSSNTPPKVGAPVASDPLARIILPKDEYSVSESDVTLTANVSGGVYSGTGVTGNVFSPRSAGSAGSPYTLSYLLNIVNTAHNCSQQASKKVIVNPNVSSFDGFDPLYCHDSGQDTIIVTGVPTGATDRTFTLTDINGIIYKSGDTIAIDPGKMRPGINKDSLYFSYKYLGIFYQISESFKIDSVGTEINILNLNPAYCQNDPKEYISVEGVYPIGGTATWTGDILSDTKPASAYADPSLGTAGVSYPVFYQYKSPNGCYSAVLRDTVTINPLPNPSFPLNSTYNIDGGPVALIPVQTGGTFSGNGVSGDKMFPDIAGLGEHEIKYSITDANSCSAILGLKTRIRVAQGNFIDIPSVICYKDTTYNVKIINLPVPMSGVQITGFTNTKNTLVYTFGATNADYNVPAAGEGLDTLIFAYKWDGVDYSISKAINVDSLGQVVIKNLTYGEIICDNKAPYELFPSVIGGVFTGPVSGGYLYPLNAMRADTVTYTYTNIKTGCITSTVMPIIVYPAPKVAFAPADVCIENNTDKTFFNNNTTSKDMVKTWLWEFADAGAITTSEHKEAAYLYTSGGLQKITLTATTVNNCSSTKESTFNLGRRPDADFYWKSDCLHPNDSVILLDATIATSPIDSLIWKIYNGTEFDTIRTQVKEARYPKSHTGYLKFQYIVKTTYANCSDTVTKDVFIKPAITIDSDGYFEDFEAGSGGWIKGDTTGNSWSFGQPEWEDIDTSALGQNAWFTTFIKEKYYQESSSIVSPCFDFTVTERPLIKLNLLKRFTREIDGASLQYRISDNEDWQNVGALEDGIEWYNSAVIRGKPGGNQIGWTTRGDPDNKWVESIHTLDELKGKSDVKFRIAYGSDGSLGNEGIAFNEIWIGERSRNILLEHFTNNGDITNSNQTANALVDTILVHRSEDVIGIQYHTNFPGADSYYDANQGDVSARILFYGLTRTPYTFIDGGTKKDFAYMYAYDSDITQIDSNNVTKRSLIPSRFDISLTTSIFDRVLTVNGKIKALEDINSDNLTLFIAVTEKRDSLGNKEFRNIFRKFIPDAGGILLQSDWTKKDSITIEEQTWMLDKILNKSKFEVIAFIQNTITKEVFQASSVIQPAIVVGIENPQGASGNDFILYPNPAVKQLTISFEEPLSKEADVKIYDMLGVVISSYRTGSGVSEFTIDDLNLKGGLYLVRITSGGIDLGFRKLVVSGD